MAAMVVGVALGGDVAAGSGSRGGGDDEDSGCGVDWVRYIRSGAGGVWQAWCFAEVALNLAEEVGRQIGF
ncbi:hypothetical protein Tco_0615719 [Tanacetum coccineum]